MESYMPKGKPKNGSKYFGKFHIGQKFGLWEVVDNVIVQINSQGGASVKVKCECGTESFVSCLRLLRGESSGCPCKLSGYKNFHWKGTKNISGRYLNTIKKSAINRNKEWAVTDEYLQKLLEQQEFKCALSGYPIEFSHKSIKHTASLDRIDNSKGYVIGNVQWVHKNINIMKHIFSNNEFIQLCKVVYDYNRDRLKNNEVSEQTRVKQLFSNKSVELDSRWNYHSVN